MERYKEVKNELIKLISQKSDNERLPTVRALMKKFNTSQITIDKSLFELKNEGLISAHVGKGIFVSRSTNVQNDQELNIICFIVSDPKIPQDSTVLNESVRILHGMGYQISIFFTGVFNYGKYNLIKEMAMNKNVRGWVVIPDMHTIYDPEFHELIESYIPPTVPFISVDFPLKIHPSHFLSVDNYLSGREIGNELLKNFRGKIGFLWIPESNPCQQRMLGLMSASRDSAYDFHFIPHSQTDFIYLQQEIYKAYESGVRTFVIANPLIVCSFVKAYYEGIKNNIFNDVDEMKIIAYVEPDHLSILPDNFIRVNKPSAEIGSYAAKSILQLIDKKDIELPKKFKCTIDVPQML